MDPVHWKPVQLVEPERHTSFKYALIVLNTPISVPQDITCSLWQNAQKRILVDGGTNRWLSFLKTLPKDGAEMKTADIVSGDFDSVTEDTLAGFRKRGTIIMPTPDQDETDFTKAVRLLKPIVEMEGINSIIAIHEHSTRFDHIMANINTLYKAAKFLNDTRLYLLNNGSLTWLLAPGRHSIQVPAYLVDNGRWCSMIPFSGKSTVTTKGFKWDLDNGVLEFGTLVSSSNTYVSTNLEIETDTYLVWSMGVFDFD